MKTIKKLAEDIRVCMMITEAEESARPMATIKVDSDDSLWFFTNRFSGKVHEINEDMDVRLIYCHPGKESYMDLRGKAMISTDKAMIKEKWSPMAKPWFPGGVYDPDICLIKVTPLAAYYWDSGTSKMVTLMKMAAAAATGKQFEGGEEGKVF